MGRPCQGPGTDAGRNLWRQRQSAVLKFIDTNVRLHAAGYEQADRPKRARALELLAEGDCAMSGQVLGEVFVNATRANKLNLPHAVASEWLDDFRRFPVLPVTADIVAWGAVNAARHRISYWDGAILAAAEELGANTLYTEDLNAGQRYGAFVWSTHLPIEVL